jgi:hypothetical protein
MKASGEGYLTPRVQRGTLTAGARLTVPPVPPDSPSCR